MFHTPSRSQPNTADSLEGYRPQSPGKELMNTGKEIKISARVTEKEKQTIMTKAKKCGLSVSEYIKQRALGYEPRTVPPDTLFLLLEKLGNLEDKSTSAKLNAEIGEFLKEITNTLLLPGKEGSLSQLPDSGPFTGA